MSAHAPPGTISTRRAEEQGDVSIAALLMARATATQIADHDRASPVGIGIPPVVGAVRIPAVIGTIRLIGADDHDRRRHLISRDWGRRHHDAMREANQEGHPHRQYDEPSFEALHRQLSTSAMCFGRRARHPARPGPWWHTDSSTSGGYLQHMLCHSERSAFRRREKRPGARITRSGWAFQQRAGRSFESGVEVGSVHILQCTPLHGGSIASSRREGEERAKGKKTPRSGEVG